MPTDSSVAGYLVPSSTAPQADVDLDAILQSMIVGLTGLAGNLVRPRWQPVSPKQPEPSTNWCAIGVTNIEQDANPAIVHNGIAPVSDTMYRHEELSILVSFYGPQGQRYAEQARDGLYLPQNRDVLKQYRMGLADVGSIRSVPEQVNMQWIRRYDFTITMRRQVVRTYSIQNIESAEFILSAEIDIETGEPAIHETVEVTNQ